MSDLAISKTQTVSRPEVVSFFEDVAWWCDAEGGFHLDDRCFVNTELAARLSGYRSIHDFLGTGVVAARPLHEVIAGERKSCDISVWTADRFHLRVQAKRILDGHGGNYTVGCFRDTTREVNRAEDLNHLGTEYDLLHAAIQASPVNITIADARQSNLCLTFVNKAFVETTGYTEEEALGRNCKFLQGPNTDPRSVERIVMGINRRIPIDVEIVNYRKNGEEFINFLSLSPVFDDAGELQAFLGIQRDVTGERLSQRSEQTRERLESLGRLAGGVAHEINNFLQPVLMYPDLIREKLSDEDVDEIEFLESIKESGYSARSIVKDILAFSRAEDTDEQKELPDFAKAATSTTKFISGILPSSVIIEQEMFGIEPGLKLPISQQDFNKIIMNLCINAAHSMDNRGAIRLVFSAFNNMATIEVKDTGTGIPEDVQGRIFEPFYTTKPVGAGTGLGLSIVHSIVSGAGGSIGIKDTGPKGTNIEVRFGGAKSTGGSEQ